MRSSVYSPSHSAFLFCVWKLVQSSDSLLLLPFVLALLSGEQSFLIIYTWLSESLAFPNLPFQTTSFFLLIKVPNIYSFFFFLYCSGFCHTLKWNSHWFTCVPHPDPPSHLPLHPIPLGLPSAPGPSACLMHPTWAGDLFHPR